LVGEKLLIMMMKRQRGCVGHLSVRESRAILQDLGTEMGINHAALLLFC